MKLAAGSARPWSGMVLLMGLLWCCAGCGGGASSAPPAMPQALVVGSASGVVLQTIRSEYQTVTGTGEEDPTPYAMIIFDGNDITPAQLQGNPGVKNFLAAGKAVVILNNTEAHRSIGLRGAAWMHEEGSSPAAGWIYVFNRSGRNQKILGQKELSQIDFPVRMIAAPRNGGPTLVTPASAQLQQDSEQWLRLLNQAIASAGSDIGTSTCGANPSNPQPSSECANQTALSFHATTPISVNVPSQLNGQAAPYATAWGPSGTQPPNADITINATFETRGYALLEGNATSGYFHKILVRQYLNVSPPPARPSQSWSSSWTQTLTQQYPIVGSCDQWTFPWPVYSTLGWNDSVQLVTQLNVARNSVGIDTFLPQKANNTTTLTTSENHTETVGVSATAGVQNGNPLGTLSASWSDSWSWGQAQTISIQDWEAGSSISGDNTTATYDYDAFGNSEITHGILLSHLLDLPLNGPQLSNAACDLPYLNYPTQQVQPPALNGLQTNALATQSETVWVSDGLLPPQVVKLASSATITSGEVTDAVAGDGPHDPPITFCSTGCSGYQGFTGFATTPLNQTFDLDFSTPALQPPGWNTALQKSVPAPWTLSFPAFPDKIALNQPITGTVTMPQAVLAALMSARENILLSYVVEPLSPLQTLPAEQVCPGNEFNFNPGNNAVSNGNPPLRLSPSAFTCTAGTCSASVSLTLQTSQTNQYTVQAVAWLPSITFNGQTVLSPQSAWCLDVPETTIGS